MNKKKYFIKDGYEARDINVTLDDNREEVYWTDEAINLNSYFQWSVYTSAVKIIKKNKLKKVVDIGCGAAKKLDLLIKPCAEETIGIDQKNVIDFCNKKYNGISFLDDNFESPKQQDLGNVDLIISSDVIEHISDPDILLNYIKSIASSNTTIIISTPERDLLRGKDCMKSDKPEHVREWNKEEFAKYIEHSGFDIVSHQILPFMKFNLFSKECRFYRKIVRKKSGTVNTCQMVICKIK